MFFRVQKKTEVNAPPKSYFQTKWKVEIEKNIEVISVVPNQIVLPIEPYAVILSGSGKATLDQPVAVFPISLKDAGESWQFD